ncbi:MAG TPA: wax ester/triacylglycerol synthase family O-acyltransferase [Solirubrobacteraceae bacterium]|nr:wax ester/triacylglycerol synthase family O-acyltransferase [Solirubrobacteraceae bacterium]
MAQAHLDRLTPVDASFLLQESDVSHMHIGAVVVVEGPPPTREEFLEMIRLRLHLVPRYRHKLAHTIWDSNRPVWVDDPSFNPEYHIRHTALPAPGDWKQLEALTGRIYSQQLDRSKPLWEIWMVEGLEEDRFALITKTHHALIDGIAGVDIATVLFDISPDPPVASRSRRPWKPRAEPGSAHLLAAGLVGTVRAGAQIAEGVLDAMTHPERALKAARDAVEGISELVWAGLNPAPETPLNVPIGPHRRFVTVDCRLDDLRLVKNAFGGTVNDVVLAVVSGALRTFMEERGARTEGLEMRALVPVSVRTEDERGQVGNRVAAMRGPLPVYIADPVQRLEFVRGAMAGLKESKQALGAEVIAGVESFAPPTLLAQASRLNFSTRLFNLIITNVPGPQFPLYVLGREMQKVVPIAFLPEHHALAIAIMSYNGRMDFGLLGDYDAMADIEDFGEMIRGELAQFVELAHDAMAARA